LRSYTKNSAIERERQRRKIDVAWYVGDARRFVGGARWFAGGGIEISRNEGRRGESLERGYYCYINESATLSCSCTCVDISIS